MRTKLVVGLVAVVAAALAAPAHAETGVTPVIVVVPGQTVTVLVTTPSGRIVNVVRKIDGRPV